MNSEDRAAWAEFAGDTVLDNELEEAETQALHEWAATPPDLPPVHPAVHSAQCTAPTATVITVPDESSTFKVTPTQLIIAMSMPIDVGESLIEVWKEFAASRLWDERTEQLFIPLYELLCTLLDQLES